MFLRTARRCHNIVTQQNIGLYIPSRITIFILNIIQGRKLFKDI